MCPHVSGTELMDFSKQDARGNLVIASLPVNFPFSASCQRFLLRTSIGLNTIHTFLSHKYPQTDTFLRYLGLAKLRSTAWVWNPQGTSKLVNRLIVACHMTAYLKILKEHPDWDLHAIAAAAAAESSCPLAGKPMSLSEDGIHMIAKEIGKRLNGLTINKIAKGVVVVIL
jgi:hypothetical protein